jgi:hypothetical protein
VAEGQQDPASAGMPLEDVAPTPDYVEGTSSVRNNAVEPPVSAVPPGQGHLETAARPSDITGTEDRGMEIEAGVAPLVTPQQIIQIKRMQADHQYRYRPTDLPPQDQRKFEHEMVNSAWGQGFMSQFGMSKQQFVDMVNKDPSYDYRGAWKQKLVPDQAGAHWRDRGPDGKFLKSPDHPTAWMEYYQAVTGRDPEADGVDTQKYNQLLFGPMAQTEEGRPRPGGHPTEQPARPTGREMYASIDQEAQRLGITREQARRDPNAAISLIHSVMKSQGISIPQKRTAFLGMGQKPAPAPQVRDGQPVGPDGYTAAEREYMKGAGVDPSKPQPKGSPGDGGNTPAPAAKPGSKQLDIDRMLEEAERGKARPGGLGGARPRSKLGGVRRQETG